MNRRLIHLFLLMSLTPVSACGGDEPADKEQGSGGFVVPGEEPYVSPEDSAKAAEDVQARADAIRDSLRRAAGDDEPNAEDAPSAPAAAGSPEARYRACMAQASQADAGMRERLQAACDNIRAQSPAAAPTP